MTAPWSNIVFVDEAQDTNNALYEVYVRHLKTSAPNALVMVGDPNQAIQIWAGAHPAQMKRIALEHNAEKHTLSLSRRCSKAVAEYVRVNFGGRTDLDNFSVPDDAEKGYIGTLTFGQMAQDFKNAVQAGDQDWKYKKDRHGTYGSLLLARTNGDAIG